DSSIENARLRAQASVGAAAPSTKRLLAADGKPPFARHLFHAPPRCWPRFVCGVAAAAGILIRVSKSFGLAARQWTPRPFDLRSKPPASEAAMQPSAGRRR